MTLESIDNPAARRSPVGRFLAWWIGELAALVPGGVTGADSRVELSFDTEGARVALARRRGRVELGHVDPAKRGARRAVRRMLRRRGLGGRWATVRLPRGEVLRTTTEVPVAAAENLREALAFEMDRHTPFPAEEVLFDFRVAGSDPELERLKIDLLAARRSDVRAALERARALGLTIDRVAGPAGEEAGFNLLPEGERPRRSRAMRTLLIAAAALTVGLAAANVWVWFDRQEAALERSDAAVAELRAMAGEAAGIEERVDRLASRAAYLGDKKREQPLAVALLDELASRLGDEHWLVTARVQGGELQISGYSDDPSSLLRLMEQSPMFTEARFSAPVTMDPRVEKERFSLLAAIATAEAEK